MEAFFLLGLVFALFLLLSHWKTQARRQELMDRYGEAQVVDMIMAKTIWQGQTPGQLLDSLGKPFDIDQRVMKTKTKEVWKYDHRGGNKFGLRITLEDNSVVGWDQK